jgi:hypothetical protein
VGTPASQHETWSRQGALTTANATDESIRRAFAATSSLKASDVEVYLQGSSKNDPNIRGARDADVVVQLNATWLSELSALPQGAPYERNCHAATYPWAALRRDVLSALRAYDSPSSVTAGNHALTVAGGSGRLSADVVVGVPCRKDRWYLAPGHEHSVEGMAFDTLNEHRRVINFPNVHGEHGIRTGHEQRAAAESVCDRRPSVPLPPVSSRWSAAAGAPSGRQ